MLYKSILLIDDDLEDAEILFQAIRSLEEKIVCRIDTNPTKALEDLKKAENLPDHIFLDLNMPTFSGLEFLQELKKEERLANIKIILYSGHSKEFMDKLCQNFEGVTCIKKPDNYQELVAVLTNIQSSNPKATSFS